MTRVVPKTWMVPSKIQRIIMHWTAGNHVATQYDRGHYHILINYDGELVKGIPPISGNSSSNPKGKRANHTLNANGGSIGISLACMGNAKENPFDPGKYPMTKAQWDKMILAIADLCEHYKIEVTPRTVLSHAEVQNNLGIKQRGKWDFTRLAFDLSVKGAKACGDKARSEVMAALAGETADIEFSSRNREDEEPEEPMPTQGGDTVYGEVPNWVNTASGMQGDALHWTAQMQAAKLPPDRDWQVFAVQTRLKGRNYNPGGIDGIWGGMTSGAIAGFINDRGGFVKVPTSWEEFRQVYSELANELSRAESSGFVRPVAEARVEASAATVDKVAPESVGIRRNFLSSAWMAVVGFVSALFSFISSKVNQVWEFFTGTDGSTVQTVFQIFKQIPTSVWIVVGACAALWIALNARQSLQKIEADIKTGERV